VGTAYSNFIGSNAGRGAICSNHVNSIGTCAGYGATNVCNSNFIGSRAGCNAANANYSNFIGSGAGSGASSNTCSIFIGFNAGVNATNMCHVIAIGRQAFSDCNGASYCAGSAPDISGSILLGAYSTANGPGQLSIGSCQVPIQTAAGGYSCNAACFLVAKINGACFKIPLMTYP
jgi:hypothetical protein